MQPRYNLASSVKRAKIAVVWSFKRVVAPIVGTTKREMIGELDVTREVSARVPIGAAGALDIELTEEEDK